MHTCAKNDIFEIRPWSISIGSLSARRMGRDAWGLCGLYLACLEGAVQGEGGPGPQGSPYSPDRGSTVLIG